MAPVWAYASGLVLNVDVISQYSVTIPAVITFFCKWLGGVSYERAIWLFMMGTIIYFYAFYCLTCYWLRNSWLAAAALVLAIKWQMFHPGVLPNIWFVLTPTVIRYWWDLLVIFLCLRHAQTLHRRYLLGACVVCGISLAWVIDTGVYLTAAVYAYMALILFQDEAAWRDKMRELPLLSGLMAVAIIVAMAILVVIQGRYPLTSLYWKNYFEHADLFIEGWGAIPMYGSISQRHFSEGLFGFLVPVIYVWTMLLTVSLCMLKKWAREHLFVAFLCIYGLGLYHYYVHRSAITSYHAVCIPLVLILSFWFKKWIDALPEKDRKSIPVLVTLLLLVFLATDKVFLKYPDVFNLKRPGSSKFGSFDPGALFPEDVSMVQRLTKEGQRVPLISDNEVIILMQANRKPFFYYFPLINNVNNSDVLTHLHTHERLDRTIAQLDGSRPEYVFIRKEFWIPPSGEGFDALMAYIKGHYDIDEQGRYLLALKRK